MGKTIKAKYTNGKIEPLEKVDLKEGEEISVTILDISSLRSAKSGNSFERAAGSWKGSINAEELIANIYRSRLISTRDVPRL